MEGHCSRRFLFLFGGRTAEDGLLPLVVHLRRQVAYLHVHGLMFLKLGRNGAEPIIDLVTRHRYIFPFDVGNVTKNVLAATVGRNETMSFGAAKGFHNTTYNWVFHGPRRSRGRACAPRDDRAR